MRQKNAVKSVKITITTTHQVRDHLVALLPIGLYGSSVAEVAERLLCEQLCGDLKKYRQTLLVSNLEPKP